jgi:hypothetical protein
MTLPLALRRTACAVLLPTLLSSAIGCAPGAESSDTVELGSSDQALRPIDDDPFEPDPDPRPRPPPPPPPPMFVQLMSRYTNFDMNGDGRVEIDSLRPAFPNPAPYARSEKGVLIVFVDPRLLADDPNSDISGFEMGLWLSMYSSDLADDGYFPYFVAADVYDGTVHQDGRTLLAMRRFLRDVRQHYPLAGTLLVGSFPEASIARSVLLKQHEPNSITFGSSGRTVSNVNLLEVGGEFITPRAEIVLGDLDGNWEGIYRQEPFTFKGYKLLPGTTAFPSAGQVIESGDYNVVNHAWQDVFFVDDAAVTTSETNGRVRVAINSLDEQNLELAPSDRLMPNRIARPEIMVSRLNTRHVAIKPTAPTDLDGKASPIGADGKPQTLRYASQQRVRWVRDPHLERKLLTDYIGRQRRFRLGYDNNKPFRTSAIRQLDSGLKDPGSFNSLLRGAASGFTTSIATDNASLLDYLNWLKQPAVLRGIASHSNDVISQFGPTSNHLALESAIGGKPWRWVGSWVGADYVLSPSLAGHTQDAYFAIHRSMWENGALASAGQFFTVHDGCDVNKPSNYLTAPYSSASYGQANDNGGVQNGESLLFYANGLAIMGRNKVFNDTPAGFVEAVRAQGAFGRGWGGYFYREAAQESLDERDVAWGSERRTRSLQRKRSYFWNVLGDWTLELRYP